MKNTINTTKIVPEAAIFALTDNIFSMAWNNNDAAKQEIEQILTMKVGERCAKNDIYFRVNEYCNNFELNSSADFLYKKCYEKFKNEVPNKKELDSIICTVLD